MPGIGGAPDSVLFRGSPVVLEERTETLRSRNPETGEISDSEMVVQVVPHHGPILDGTNDGISATSFRWTGLVATRETEAFTAVLQVRNIDQFMANIFHFDVGGQSLVYCDVDGHIYYNSYNAIPVRPAAGLT